MFRIGVKYGVIEFNEHIISVLWMSSAVFFSPPFLHYSTSLMVSSWVLWGGFFFLVLQMNNRRVDLELYWCRQCSANRKLVPFLWPLLLIINWLAILPLVRYNFRRQWHVPLKGGCAWASTSGHCCHEPVGQWLRTNQPTLWTGPSWVSETFFSCGDNLLPRFGHIGGASRVLSCARLYSEN